MNAGSFRRALRAATVVGVAAPMLIIGIAVTLTLVWIPRLPDPMAVHWGLDGAPDGFGPRWLTPAMAASIGVLLVGLSTAFWWPRRRGSMHGVWAPTHRFMAAFVLGNVTFIEGIAVGTAVLQLDQVEAAGAGGIWGVLGLSLGLAVAAGVLGWLCQPAVEVTAGESSDAAPIELGSTERAVWLGVARPRPAFVIVMTWLSVMTLGAGIAMSMSGPPVGLILIAVALLLAFLMALTSWFRVRVDASGFEARSWSGWPEFRIPLNEIERVEVRDFEPFAEFGGWGLRWAPGVTALVLRGGQGMKVVRKTGRAFVVTVEGADRGAALLAAELIRANERSEVAENER
ncbi:DUF1648 domain-containing protein [Leucobacter luti]|uniref:DUF1648 domain-containing protein n=1 Tax=Leucobacter luti TaxID=340320 RepID=UPI003D0841ED